MTFNYGTTKKYHFSMYLKSQKRYNIEQLYVKNARGGLNFSYFYFSFDLFSFILFLEPGLEGQDYTVTQQVTSDNMVTSHMTHRRM